MVILICGGYYGWEWLLGKIKGYVKDYGLLMGGGFFKKFVVLL